MNLATTLSARPRPREAAVHQPAGAGPAPTGRRASRIARWREPVGPNPSARRPAGRGASALAVGYSLAGRAAPCRAGARTAPARSDTRPPAWPPPHDPAPAPSGPRHLAHRIIIQIIGFRTPPEHGRRDPPQVQAIPNHGQGLLEALSLPNLSGSRLASDSGPRRR